MKKCLYISHNKAIVRNKELICITNIVNDSAYNNLYVEADYIKNYGEVFIDFGFICMGMGRTLDKNDNIESIKYSLENLSTITIEAYENYITKCLNNMQFINVAEIKLMEITGKPDEYIQQLTDHRQNVLNLREQKNQEQQQKKEQEEKQYIEQKNNEVADKVYKTEQAIINKERVQNIDITVYKSKYDSNTMSIFLYLMKQYNINVPLKTQGWINKALANIYYDERNNEYTYQYYTSSACSTVFDKYLNMLVNKIKEKYNIAA